MSPSTNPTTRRTAASIVRRLGVAVALSSAGLLMTGGVAQAQTTSPPVDQLQSDSPNRFGCHMNEDRYEDLCIDTNDNDAMDVVIFDLNDNGNYDFAWVDTDHDGVFEWVFENTDDDLYWDRAAVDTDGDGQADRSYRRGQDAWYPNESV